MSDKNGSIKEEVVEGSFSVIREIIKRWWVIAIGIVVYLVYIGKLDMRLVNFAVDRFVQIATAVKGIF
jgi:hypothetical protein